jgi:hypothetical protein
MTARSKFPLALVATIAILGFALALFLSTRAEGGAGSPELVGVRNAGVPVAPTAAVRGVLVHTDTADGTLLRLGKKYDTTFYRVEGTNKRGDCYGVARGEGAAHRINSLRCGGDFPSLDNPVLDASVFEAAIGSPAQYDQLKGWTVDRVALIQMQTRSGETLVERAPTGNFYYVPRSQVPDGGVRLVALDATGSIIWQNGVRE